MTLTSHFMHALNAIVSEGHLMTDPTDCWLYNYHNGRHRASPAAVVFAREQRDVIKIVKCCYANNVSLVVRGRGSNAPCRGIPILGGVVLSLEKMNKILDTDFDNHTMVVQAGVLNNTVQDVATSQKFCWTPLPINTASIGSNISYNTAGPRAIKYGPLREHTLGLKVVLGNGDIITTGFHNNQTAVGHDFMQLIIGAEGTLGIITEATLKLTPLFESEQTLQLFYQNNQSAIQAMNHIMSQPYVPCALEFLDQACVQLIQQHGVVLPENSGAILLINIDGLATAITIAIEKIIAAGSNSGLIKATAANTPQQAKEFWYARKSISSALRMQAENILSDDISLPIVNLEAFFIECAKLTSQFDTPLIMFGHVSNNHKIQLNLLINHTLEQQQHAEACLNEIFTIVLKLKGTLLGEHGISLAKRAFLDRMIDPVTLNLMRAVKQQFDPHNILNPGKLFS
jgi:D-lactate dehydrogenase